MQIRRSWLALTLLLVGLTASSCGTDPAPAENVSVEAGDPAQTAATQPQATPPAQQNAKPVVIVLRNPPTQRQNRNAEESMGALKTLEQEYRGRLEFIYTEQSQQPPALLEDLKARGGEVANFLEANKNNPLAVAVFNREGKKLTARGLSGSQSEEVYRGHFLDALDEAQKAEQNNPSTPPAGRRDQTPTNLDGRLASIQARLDEVERKQTVQGRTLDEFPFNSLGATLLTIATGLALIVALGLAVWNALIAKSHGDQLKGLEGAVRRLGNPRTDALVVPTPGGGKSSRALEEIEGLKDQLQELQTQARNNGERNRERLEESERRFAEVAQALREVTAWMGELQLNERAAAHAAAASARHSVVSDIEPLAAEVLVASERVEPLRQAVGDIIQSLRASGQATGEIGERLRALYGRVAIFHQLHRDLEEVLKSARRDAAAEMRARLDADRLRLSSMPADQLTLPRFVKQYRQLHESFTAASGDGARPAPPSVNRADIQQRLDGVLEELMNWFDDFYQLLNQARAQHAEGTSQFDADVLAEMVQAQRTAREVLNRFDIQPEEIVVGRTNYDRRLHEAVHVRQSSQYPTNTVIEVQRSGFHRASDGTVLRRPQVVIAGTA